MGFVIESFRGRKVIDYYFQFMIYFRPSKLPWKQICFRGSFCGSNLRGSFHGSFRGNHFPWNLTRKTFVQVTSTEASEASMEFPWRQPQLP